MTNFSKRPVPAVVLAFALACALLLALPGETVTTKYLNDLFIFFDGVHRVFDGQVPNRDFHTALGPLNYYIPAAGYWLSGHFGGAMPVGMALVVLALAPAAAHILDSRLRPAIALPLGAFLILIVAVPINPGESIGALSFAMFYNRIGWASLGLLLVLYLRPTRLHAHQAWLDGASAAFLVLLMLYTKASYGAVGLGFLVFLLLDRDQRGWIAGSLAAILAGGLLVEAFWGGTRAHVSDLILAGQVSGTLDTIDELAQTIFHNFADYTVYALVVVLVVRQTRHWRDLLFFGFCAGSGFLLIGQNFQHWGIITLGAGAAVGAELLARADSLGPRRSLAAGAPMLLLVLMLPPTLHNLAALGLHAGLAATGAGQSVGLPQFERVKLVRLWNDGEYQGFNRYVASLEDGAQALQGLEAGAGRVLVLDFVNPFTAGLDLKAPRGDSTWHHWGRTVNESHFLSPDKLFRDVQVVMEPKWPIESWTATGLREIYGEYLAEHFEVATETADWKIMTLRDSPAETVSRSPNPESGRSARGG